ncbi:MAG: helicase-related protein, partial [Nitrospinota bacterium]
GFPMKAVIFTESKRTQEYLLNHLSENGYEDKVTIFNGTNDSPISYRAYKRWEKERIRYEKEELPSKATVIREALIHEFKHHTEIFLTTEAGGEGINLQFCNTVINYDLPWNPQRVEQRIGRCHRYGQKNDVIVVNFINRKNAADRRVFELLDRKFLLFSGVFGASDEILGIIGSGIDFEMRILEICQSCRTDEEINSTFDRLQEELSEKINNRMLETRSRLIENFDDEVRAKFRVINRKVKEGLSILEGMLIKIVLGYIKPEQYEMKENLCRFTIKNIPKYVSQVTQKLIHNGSCYIGRDAEIMDGERLHLNHPMVKAIVEDLKEQTTDNLYWIKLCYTKGRHKITLLEPYIGEMGLWMVYKLTFEGFEMEEHLVNIVFIKPAPECCNQGTDFDWIAIDQKLADKFPDITAEEDTENSSLDPSEMPSNIIIEPILQKTMIDISNKIDMRNKEYYEREMDKFDTYSEEMLMELYDEIKKKEVEIEIVKDRKQKSGSFEERQKIRKDINRLEKEYSNLTNIIAREKKQLFKKKDEEIKRLEKKLVLNVQITCISRAVWRII